MAWKFLNPEVTE